MAVDLTRTIRFSAGGATDANPGSRRNGFGGSPSMAGLGAYYELEVTCTGQPDETTGYLINIKDIDAACRDSAVARIRSAAASDPERDPSGLLVEISSDLAAELPERLRRVRWRLTPFLSLEHSMSNPDRVVIRQRFDFAAAHRLHSPELSDDENRRVFGKCNNPSGHGHNYQVEPAVAVSVGGSSPGFGLADLERLCIELVIDRFDHTHLNLDTKEFGDGGVMPSVENIARVIHGILEPAIARHNAELREVTVWETDRTSCTYPAR